MNAKDNKKVTDDFYDRVNYYEARNIFSSNEPVNPNNRLYTDHVSGTHSVWNTIQQKQDKYIFDQFSDIEKETSGISGELARTIYNNLNKYTTSASSSACRLCGYVGHLAYQCRNNIVLNKKMKRSDEDNGKRKEKGMGNAEKEEGEVENGEISKGYLHKCKDGKEKKKQRRKHHHRKEKCDNSKYKYKKGTCD